MGGCLDCGIRDEVARSAAGLLEQPDRLDDDVALQRLGHVVERERGHRRGGQRLHLDPGTSRRGDLGPDGNRAGSRVGSQLDVDAVERQRMAERDELGGALCRSDAGEAGGDERVALRSARVDERGEHVGAHPNGCLGDGSARGHRLRSDVDHPRLAVLGEVARFHDGGSRTIAS